MKRTLKDFCGSNNSSNSGVGPSKKHTMFQRVRKMTVEMTAMKKLTDKLED